MISLSFAFCVITILQCSEKEPQAGSTVLEYDRSLLANAKAELDIEDYFRLLPFKAIGPAQDVKERNAILKSQKVQRKATGPCVNELEQIDRTIAYIRFACRGAKRTELVEISIWKRTGLPDLVGVNETSIEAGMSSKVKFFELREGNWNEITKSIWPSMQPADFGGDGTGPIPLYVQFSQFDRNIIVQPGSPSPGTGKIMGVRRTIKWNDGHFQKP